jgi:hypothetical protein
MDVKNILYREDIFSLFFFHTYISSTVLVDIGILALSLKNI